MMRKHKIGLLRRILAVLMSVLLAGSLVSYGGGAVTVRAAEVYYLDETGLVVVCNDAISVGSDTTTWNEGCWYVVEDSVTISDRITVSGTVNLILKDSCTLMAESGITVKEGSCLIIYDGRGDGRGELIANVDESEHNAGIGGTNGEAGGTIIINGGHITATGGNNAAGIGGGKNGSGGTITINGGSVTATGGINAAGIGGGYKGSGGTITINGGSVTAKGGEMGSRHWRREEWQ